MVVELAPFVNIAPDSTNYVAYKDESNPDSNQVNLRYLRWLETTQSTPISMQLPPGTGALVYNLFELRLRFSWPVYPNGTVGPNHQTYRNLIAGRLLPAIAPINGESVPAWYFQPFSYTNSMPPNL
jgi:hypothetical protein